MKENGSIEIISFNIVETMEEQQVVEGFKILDGFYKKHDGYYGMDIAKGKEYQWTMVLKWETKDHEKKASALMMKSDETNLFKMLIIPQTVVKNVYPCFEIN